MSEEFELSDEPYAAGIGWISCGVVLLTASPFIPATQVGWVATAVLALGFMVWTHTANPALSLSVYPFQVLLFNIPLVVWWISLTSTIPLERWISPAMAAIAVSYSFSVGAVGLYIWLINRSRLVRMVLLVATVGLLALSITTIAAASTAQAGSLVVFASVITTSTLLLQRLLALPFDDDFLDMRNKFMGLTGGALLLAFLLKLLPMPFAPALVYVGGWLLAGALFTIVGSVVEEARAAS